MTSHVKGKIETEVVGQCLSILLLNVFRQIAIFWEIKKKLLENRVLKVYVSDRSGVTVRLQKVI
jgi:hypothetical protein